MTRFLTASVLFAAVLIALLAAPVVGRAAPASDPWPFWAASDAASTAVIDHQAWDALLRRHVRPGPSGVNRVDFAAFSEADKAALAGYIDRLAALPIRRYRRAEQLAYWINLYNALTVQVVLDAYPVDSIRDIALDSGFFESLDILGVFGGGPWTASLIRVAGEDLSLDDIEHRILRPLWQDPRLHYAVNCASLGCPNLAARAYTGKTADAMLEDAAVTFINHPRAVQVNAADGGLVLSSIYDWFAEDFGGSAAAILAHLRTYAREPLRARLAENPNPPLRDYQYDWRLNAPETPVPDAWLAAVARDRAVAQRPMPQADRR